ncbi:hypothetical protein Tco_0563720 [Tanacetum coccineum]
MANATPIVTTVTKTTNKENAPDAAPRVNIQDFYEEHYEDILPIIMEKERHDKRKEVQTRLNFGENSKKTQSERENSLNSRAENSPVRFHPERYRTRGRERRDDRNMFNRLSHQRKSVHDRLNRFQSAEELYGDTYSHGTKTKYRGRSRDWDRFCSIKRYRESESPSSHGSKSSTSDRGHRKSRTKRLKLVDEDDMVVPWTCEDVDQEHRWIQRSQSCLPGILHAAEEVSERSGRNSQHQAERWGNIEDFMEQFKVETGRMKGAPECMRISGFMHEHVLKKMEEMMTVTTAFIRGEADAASKKKGHLPWKSQDQRKRHASERKYNFRGQSREGRGSNRFTPLTRTPKEILPAEAGKFKPPPPMVTLVEKRSSNKFCDFHNDKGHSTNECMQLKKQIEELVRAGKLSHLIKEIKQGRDQTKNGKKEAPTKDKSLAIYMIQPWQRITKQKLTQSFACVDEITFPPLANSDGTEGPLVIEAEIGGHMIYHMYIDGDHCTKAWMNFMIVREMSPYNGIIGRSGIREIQAVPSTAHGMLKFLVGGGIVTIRSTILIPVECATVITSSKEIPKEAGARHKNLKVAIRLNFPDQEVAIGGTLSAKGRTGLCTLLKENLDIFAWQPSYMTGVPRLVAEHQFTIREGYSPVRQKKRGQAPDRAKAIQAEVQKLVGAGIMREVYYHDLLSNPVMVKKHDGSWRMCVDFMDLNKACP